MKIKSKLVYIPGTVIDRLDHDILHYAKKIVFPHDVYTFTKEELINLIEDYTNKIIKNVHICLRQYPSMEEHDYGQEITTDRENEYYGIHKESITNQLEIFKQNLNNE